MAGGFLAIHDPLMPHGPAVGIDLGTTNSLVAAVILGKAQCLKGDENHSALLPSVVHYAATGGVVVGQRARILAAEHPHDTISSVKRFMGRNANDPQTQLLGAYKFAPSTGSVRFAVAGGKPVTPVEVSGEILRTLKRRAEAHFASKVERAVITVPAYFDDAQRQATKDAGRLAGLEVLRLINEPTAAALAYGLDKNKNGLFAVYDLGGGTFDISILKLDDGVFEVRSTAGDTALGGDDIDRAIANHILQHSGGTPPSAQETALLLSECRSAKEALTAEAFTTVEFRGKAHPIDRTLIEQLVAPLLARTGATCRRALKDAGTAANELDGIVLVGGSTRMPAVRAYVEQLFGRAPLVDIDPDQVVALGAAIQADLLTNESRKDEVLLIDVAPLSLGLETYGGIVERIIHRNTAIPCTATQVFTTFQDQQTGMDLHVVQGEREFARDCRSLAKLAVRDIPPMVAGMGRVEVRFELNADGILTVSAREQSSSVPQSVQVKPSHGLSEDEIERMLLDSIDYAEADIRARLLAEQRVEAERILAATRKQIDDYGGALLAGERPAIEAAMASLAALVHQVTTQEAIRQCIAELNSVTTPFVERIMNSSVQSLLAGQSMDSV